MLTTESLQKLPKNFSRQYGDGMSNPVFLKLPDGAEWKIYWTKHDGEIWFQRGWKDFATHYSLDHGHLLFFEYEGTSHFVVHIFDNSSVEVDYPSHGTHDGKDNLVQISDDSVEVLDEQFSCPKTRMKCRVSSLQPCKKMKNSVTTSVERSPNGVNLHQHDQTRRTTSQEAKFMKQKLDEDKGKDIFHAKSPKVEQLTSTTLSKATTFRSEHPSFMLVMKPSFINGDYLEIPPQFSEQYLKKKHAVFLLEVLDGRSWPVTLSAARITGGWLKFASENNLNVGDICVFKLIQKIQCPAFQVSIFQGVEKPSSPISQAKTELSENANTDISKCSIVNPSTNRRDGKSSEISSGLESYFKAKRAHKEASKFTSENPFFMATLKLQSKTTRCPLWNFLLLFHELFDFVLTVMDIFMYELMQRVPCKFVRKYFMNMNRNVMIIQFRKRSWPVTFVLNESDTSGTLSAGWPLFSTQNKLQEGDVCIFELVNREDTTLDLH
ncbi:B3 domain-containing transcription factor VRN1, partial [Mucuna pruriens]